MFEYLFESRSSRRPSNDGWSPVFAPMTWELYPTDADALVMLRALRGNKLSGRVFRMWRREVGIPELIE